MTEVGSTVTLRHVGLPAKCSCASRVPDACKSKIFRRAPRRSAFPRLGGPFRCGV